MSGLDKVGSLEVGKLADIVVLDQNPFGVAPSEIAKIGVVSTMMDGMFTHREGDPVAELNEPPGVYTVRVRNQALIIDSEVQCRQKVEDENKDHRRRGRFCEEGEDLHRVSLGKD